MKLAILCGKRGHVTRGDFKCLQLSHYRWIGMAWLKEGAEKGQYVPTEWFPKFHIEHPRNYAEIEADFDIWIKTDKIEL